MISKAKETKILGVILAGGMSRRMRNQDKSRLMLSGKTMLEHVIESISPQVERLVLNSNVVNIDVGLDIIPDIEPGLGPMGGIYASLVYAKQMAYDKLLTVPCDTPFLPCNLVSCLGVHAHKPVVVARSNQQMHPTVALWDLSLIDDLKISLKRRELRLTSWVSKNNHCFVDWNDQIDPFFNVNTPEDFQKASAFLG